MSTFGSMAQELNKVLTGTHGESVTIYTDPDDSTGTAITARVFRSQLVEGRQDVPFIADVIRIDRDQLNSPPAESGSVSYKADLSDASPTRKPIDDVIPRHGHWEVITK